MVKNSETSDRVEGTEERLDGEELVLSQIRESLRNLRFGHVQIIVQDGVIVQIDRLERKRISRTERQVGY